MNESFVFSAEKIRELESQKSEPLQELAFSGEISREAFEALSQPDRGYLLGIAELKAWHDAAKAAVTADAQAKTGELKAETGTAAEPKKAETPKAAVAADKKETADWEAADAAIRTLRSEGLGDLYVLTRMVELGFIPKTHDGKLKWADGKFLGWKNAASWTIDGWFMTNDYRNKNAATKAFFGGWNEWARQKFAEAVKSEVVLERAFVREALDTASKHSIPQNLLEKHMDLLQRISAATDPNEIHKMTGEYVALSKPANASEAMKAFRNKSLAEEARVLSNQTAERSAAIDAYVRDGRKSGAAKKSLVQHFKASGYPAGNIPGNRQNFERFVDEQKRYLDDMNAKLSEMRAELAKTPPDYAAARKLKKHVDRIATAAKSPNVTDSVKKEAVKNDVETVRKEVERLDKELADLKKSAAEKLADLDKRGRAKPDELPALRLEAERHVAEINSKIDALERLTGATLQRVDAEWLKQIAKQYPWVERIREWDTIASEKFGNATALSKGWKVAVGIGLGIMLASAGTKGVRDVMNGNAREAAVDTADLVVGFIPVVGGINDLAVAFRWEDWNGRELKWNSGERWARLGFGIVGVVPWAGTIVKWWAQTARVAKAADATADVVRIAGKYGTYSYLGYTLVDFGAGFVHDKVPASK